MDKIKKGLGRGLSSLIGETKIEPQKIKYQLVIWFLTSINQERYLMKLV